MTAASDPQNNDSDRRDYFRIDDTVILTYRRVSSEQLDKAFNSLEGTLSNGFILAATFAGISQETKLLQEQIRLESPTAARYFEVVERKLDILARVLLLRELAVDKTNTRKVNLSAGGMVFQANEFIPEQSLLEIRLVVFPSPTGILAGGKVMRCSPNPQDDAEHPYRVAVKFTHIRESDRQLIIKHVLSQQASWLRQRALREQDRKNENTNKSPRPLGGEG